MFNNRIKIKELLNSRTARADRNRNGMGAHVSQQPVYALNDGSTNNNLQVVLELGKYDEAMLKRITTSAALKVTGTVVASLGKGQKWK